MVRQITYQLKWEYEPLNTNNHQQTIFHWFTFSSRLLCIRWIVMDLMIWTLLGTIIIYVALNIWSGTFKIAKFINIYPKCNFQYRCFIILSATEAIQSTVSGKLWVLYDKIYFKILMTAQWCVMDPWEPWDYTYSTSVLVCKANIFTVNTRYTVFW